MISIEIYLEGNISQILGFDILRLFFFPDKLMF